MRHTFSLYLYYLYCIGNDSKQFLLCIQVNVTFPALGNCPYATDVVDGDYLEKPWSMGDIAMKLH